MNILMTILLNRLFVVGIVAFILCFFSFVTWAIFVICDKHISELFLKSTLGFAVTTLLSMFGFSICILYFWFSN